MIYFLQSPDGGPVKIGHSEDVHVRRQQLQAHYGRPLALLATLPGDRDEEQTIHGLFAHLRFGKTEQFRPASELMDFIGRPLLVDIDPDAVEVMAPAPDDRMPVRLVLPEADHERLERCASRIGLSMSSCARMAVLRWIEAEEERRGEGRGGA